MQQNPRQCQPSSLCRRMEEIVENDRVNNEEVFIKKPRKKASNVQ